LSDSIARELDFTSRRRGQEKLIEVFAETEIQHSPPLQGCPLKEMKHRLVAESRPLRGVAPGGMSDEDFKEN